MILLPAAPKALLNFKIMEAATTPINWELESDGWRKRYHEKDNALQQAEGRFKELEERLEAYESGWMDKVAGYARKVIDEDKSEKASIDQQINYVDAEDWLWSFMQDWEEYKNENQGRWVAHRILFKEFIQKKQTL